MAVAPPSVSDGKSTGPNPQLTQTVAHVEEFFTYRPLTLVAAENHTDSENTRRPAKFDRHLDSSLRLLRVVYAPSIVDDLKELAEGALKSAFDAQTLPPISPNFPSFTVRESYFAKLRPGVTEVRNENHVNTIYSQTTANFCAVVASTLEFQLPVWTSGYLEWTLDSTNSRGVADGFLRLNKALNDMDLPPLSPELMRVTEDFPVLGIWEFKSLKAGSVKVLEAITQQSTDAGGFYWEGCAAGNRCPISHGLYVTGSKTAFDARRETETCKSLLSGTHVTPGPPTSQLNAGAKLHARHMTQQAWTEAVNDDATFIVIHAGNFEIIGKRERTTQTLYISDVIDVTACDYGKLHTGLFIAAIRDARDRAIQLRDCTVPPASWTKNYCTKPNIVGKANMKPLLANIMVCDWLGVVRGPSYRHPPFPFYHDSFWIRTPPCTPIGEVRKNKEKFIRLSVIEHLGSDTFRGRLEMDGIPFRGIKGEFSETVVVKYAGTEFTIERLEHEHRVLRKLLIAGVDDIPKIIGLFYYQTMDEESPAQPMTALVMEDAGKHVDASTLTRHQLTFFANALSSIHKGGFLHGNIKAHNLVIRNNLKGVAIVGFGDALSEPSMNEKADEHKRMMSFLPNPLKHVEDENHTPSFLDVYPDKSSKPSSNSPEQSSPDTPRAKRHRAS